MMYPYCISERSIFEYPSYTIHHSITNFIL